MENRKSPCCGTIMPSSLSKSWLEPTFIQFPSRQMIIVMLYIDVLLRFFFYLLPRIVGTPPGSSKICPNRTAEVFRFFNENCNDHVIVLVYCKKTRSSMNYLFTNILHPVSLLSVCICMWEEF